MSQTPQIPLPLGFAQVQTGEFLIGPCNRSAVDTVRGWPNWPGPMVYLEGPPACGKTRLAAIWAERAGAAMLPADRLGVAWAAILPDIKHVAVDGLEALKSEEALFHLANAIMDQQGSLLVTARVAPGDLGLRLADLRTRLLSATQVHIAFPDEAFLGELLVILAEQAQIAMDPAVAAYCVSRMERTQSAAVNLVAALDRRSLALKGRLTQKIAGEVLDELAGS